VGQADDERMMERRILIAESRGFPATARRLLEHYGEVILADLDRPGLEAAIVHTQVLWVRLRHRVDAALLNRAPGLEILATPTTGLTHIDTVTVERRGIELVSLRGESDFLKDVRATAEHAIGLILSLLRHIPAAAAHVNGGGWDRNLFRGSEIYGKTVGVIGYGRLGRIVARYLRAFDARVLATDPWVDERDEGIERATLDELLCSSDIVTLHVNLSEETRGFFGRREFGLLKPGSFFVNTSRGEVVDEPALIEALRGGRLAGAAVDVVTDEHTPANPLIGIPNLLVTPHIGGCTVESMQKTEAFLAAKVADLLAASNEAAPACGSAASRV
jgi:D-3-phosphoglycerate dehydrogenase / 2-oxoglutarate reductase